MKQKNKEYLERHRLIQSRIEGIFQKLELDF